MERRDYDRRQFISTLMKIEHGKLEGYVKDGMLAVQAEPELFGHFIAWNHIMGKVRDSKVAYPVIGLRGIGKDDKDLAENAVSHLMLLSPRDLVRAYDFHKQMNASGKSVTVPAFRQMLRDGIHLYLRKREENKRWWDRTVVQHRNAMKRLYRIANHPPDAYTQNILFKGIYPSGSVFAKVAALNQMTPQEAASVILTEKLPFQVVTGAMSNIKNQSVLLALLEGMTGNQVVTNTKMLTKLGVMADPILKAAYDAALARAKDDKRLNVLKAGRAVEAMDDDSDGVAASLVNLQALATKTQLAGIEGNWLILGDCSGSMAQSIELAKKIAALITERVKGKVWLVYFSTVPIPFDVTGKTYFQINQETSRIMVGGGTSIGVGLDWLAHKGEEVDGIVVVSDGGDNTSPLFTSVYPRYSKQIGKEPTVYFFRVKGDPDSLSEYARRAGLQLETFDMGKEVDYYSLPNIVQTLRANRYSLVDEIMSYPLLKLDQVYA